MTLDEITTPYDTCSEIDGIPLIWRTMYSHLLEDAVIEYVVDDGAEYYLDDAVDGRQDLPLRLRRI